MKVKWPINFIALLTAALDTGKYWNVSLQEIKEHIDLGDLIPYLQDLLGSDINLEPYTPEVRTELNDAIREIYLAYANRERKFGIYNNGLCLLISWTNEVVYRMVTK